MHTYSVQENWNNNTKSAPQITAIKHYKQVCSKRALLGPLSLYTVETRDQYFCLVCGAPLMHTSMPCSFRKTTTHAIAKGVEIHVAKEMSRGTQHSVAQVAQKQRGFDI